MSLITAGLGGSTLLTMGLGADEVVLIISEEQLAQVEELADFLIHPHGRSRSSKRKINVPDRVVIEATLLNFSNVKRSHLARLIENSDARVSVSKTMVTIVPETSDVVSMSFASQSSHDEQITVKVSLNEIKTKRDVTMSDDRGKPVTIRIDDEIKKIVK